MTDTLKVGWIKGLEKWQNNVFIVKALSFRSDITLPGAYGLWWEWQSGKFSHEILRLFKLGFEACWILMTGQFGMAKSQEQVEPGPDDCFIRYVLASKLQIPIFENL